MLSPDGLPPETSFVLTNCIYFKAQWKKEFEQTNSRDRDFFYLNGTSKKIPTMYLKDGRFDYFANELFEVCVLPYRNTNFSFVILLPRSKTLIDLDTVDIFELLPQAVQSDVNVQLPKFKSEWGSHSIVYLLKSLGINEVFTGQALFACKSFISDVVHKAVIIVDEKGTEAAAATGIMLESCCISMPKQSISFTVDHPFYYWILDQTVQNVLFMGICVDPVAP